MNNKIRIIAGTLRSRLIHVPDEASLRPTPNRVRETLFNWLRDDLNGAHCLDLFAGSGALGFEALSRGASSVTFVEKVPRIMHYLKKNAEDLKLTDAKYMQADTLVFLKKSPPTPFDIVFIDPPYAENLVLPCLELLIAHHFLSAQAKIYFEHKQRLDEVIWPEGITLLKHQQAGKVYYGLLSIGR